jgi:AhpD family alkylhydroperoxidase
MTVPGALEALMALTKSIEKFGVPRATLELVNRRASQINGCSVCLDLHSRALKKIGEKDERIIAVAAWREAPYYSDAERAALALTEAATRLNDRCRPGPRKDLEGGLKALQRGGTRRARHVERAHQPMEPSQRGDPASGAESGPCSTSERLARGLAFETLGAAWASHTC